MAVQGRKPKPAGHAVNRQKPAHEWTEVQNIPYEDAPRLPKRPVDLESLSAFAWPAWTKRWWESVSTMPHCSLWSDSDWQFAFDTALLAAKVHEGDARLATELRNREKVMGTTVDYRRDLRIRYVDPPSEESGPDADVTRLDDYRDL